MRPRYCLQRKLWRPGPPLRAPRLAPRHPRFMRTIVSQAKSVGTRCQCLPGAQGFNEHTPGGAEGCTSPTSPRSRPPPAPHSGRIPGHSSVLQTPLHPRARLPRRPFPGDVRGAYHSTPDPAGSRSPPSSQRARLTRSPGSAGLKPPPQTNPGMPSAATALAVRRLLRAGEARGVGRAGCTEPSRLPPPGSRVPATRLPDWRARHGSQ